MIFKTAAKLRIFLGIISVCRLFNKHQVFLELLADIGVFCEYCTEKPSRREIEYYDNRIY